MLASCSDWTVLGFICRFFHTIPCHTAESLKRSHSKICGKGRRISSPAQAALSASRDFSLRPSTSSGQALRQVQDKLGITATRITSLGRTPRRIRQRHNRLIGTRLQTSPGIEFRVLDGESQPEDFPLRLTPPPVGWVFNLRLSTNKSRMGHCSSTFTVSGSTIFGASPR